MKTVVLAQKSIHAGNLILVNAQYSYHEDAQPYLYTSVSPTERAVWMENHAGQMLSLLMNELGGWKEICAVSGWRSMEEQQKLYAQSLRDNGEEFTKKFVAFPGCSEHQTGLAIDLGLKKDSIDFICPDFPDTGICHVFREKAARYGFVERYPRGKEQITGIAHEPWHFRYVGAPHAEIMSSRKFTLEEYHEFLKQHPYGKRHCPYSSQSGCFFVSYLKAQQAENTQFEIADEIPFSVSGNNTDGYIITERRDQGGT